MIGTEPVKIVEYLHTVGGGHWRYVMELSKSLAELEETVVLSPEQLKISGDVRTIFALSAIDSSSRGVFKLIDRLRVYTRHTSQLARVLDAERAESGVNVVHFQTLPAFRARRIIAVTREKGYVAAVTVHNVYPHSSDLIARLQQREAIRAWASADVLIVHSDRLRVALASLVRDTPICVVPHPIWPESAPLQSEVDRSYLFFGVLRTNKGVDYYIDALALLGNPPASIVGSGSPKMIRHIRDKLERLSLTACDFVPGYFSEEEVPSLFQRHAVVVAPYTHFAAQSGVTHLAMAHRRPLVVTDTGGLGDPVREFRVGAIVGHEAGSIARGMQQVLEGSLAGEYSSGFDEAAAVLGIEAVARRTVECLEDASKGLIPPR